MATRLLETGWVTEAGANRPFLLHDGAVWLVERGQVDVFCVRRDGDGRVTGRSYVARVAAERCLIGVDLSGGPGARSSGVLQAVGRPGTLLRRLPPAVARELFADADAAGETTRLIDGWIDAMCDGLAVDPLPRDCQPIRQTSTIRLDRAVRVSPASGVSWIAHREGRSRLFGRPELPMQKRLMPCSVRTWFETTAPAEVAVFSTPTVLATGDVWAGLAAFHRAAIRFALWRMDTSAAVEAFRQRRRLAERSALLEDAFAGLSAVHDAADDELPVRPVDPASDRAADSLPEACRLVGAALGHRIAPGPVRDAIASADPVAAIARASGVRVRRVLLDDRWWRSDSGPLLGRTGGDRPRWVALLPDGRSRYTLHDPSDGTRAQVNPRLAATLAPVAHTFYRPFPQVVLGPRELIRFGVSGCGPDLVTVVVLGLAGGLLGLATPVATGTLFNTVIPGAERDQLIQVTLLLLACAGATGMFELVRRLALARVDGRMGAAVQAAVWDRLLSLPLGFFRPYAAGDLAVRAMGIDGMRKALSGATMTAALGGMFSLSNLVLLFYYGGSLAWWATLLLAVAVCVTLAAGYGQLGLQRQIVPLRTKTSGLVLQLLTGISKLRVAAAEAYGFAQWARLFSRQRHLQFRSRTVGNWLQVFNAMFPTVALLVIMAAATSGGTTMPAIRTGDYLAFASAFGACLAAMVSISEAAMEALGVVPMYEAARPILDATPEASEAQSDPGALTGRIEGAPHHVPLPIRYTACARRRVDCGASRRVRRDRRSVRIGQVDAAARAARVRAAACRVGLLRRPGLCGSRRAGGPRADRCCPAVGADHGGRPLHEHRWFRIAHARRCLDSCADGRPRRRHPGDADGDAHRRQRGRKHVVGWAATAVADRAGHRQPSADDFLRRGDQRARQPHAGDCQREPCPAERHEDCDRAPPEHDRAGGPNPCHGAGPHRAVGAVRRPDHAGRDCSPT